MSKTPTTPTHSIQHIELEVLEKEIYSRNYNVAGIQMLSALSRMRTGAEFAFKRYHDDDQILGYYARLAASIGAYVCDPNYIPSDTAYIRLCLEVPTIEAIFKASPMHGGEHIARILANNPTERDPAKLEWDIPQLAKWLLFCGLDSKTGVNYDELFGKAARLMMPWWVGLLVTKIVYTSEAMERKNALLKMGHYFSKFEIPDDLLGAFADAFMYASYATSEDRHEVKGVITKMLAHSISKRFDVPPVKRVTGRGKPTILIPIEWFGSFHAMHRCYAGFIDQLRTRFKLVACGRLSMLDDNARGYFDSVIAIPEKGVELKTMMKEITELAPDIVFYPSVGMALWWVALATQRLAPIQIMSVGHPASSFSPEMDYVISDERALEPSCFTERCVMLPSGFALHFIARPDYAAAAPKEKAATPGICNVAIPAMTMKLNHLFFDSLTCLEIKAKEEGVTIRYHFFTNLLGVEHRASAFMLRRMFEGCVAYPRVAGPKYLEQLAACDFSLAPFPFGGTNSTVDALLLGLPVVTLWGKQPHERFDALLLEKIGLHELVAKTPEEFEAICLRLCNDVERASTSAKIIAADCETAFYSPLPSQAWVNAFRYIYDHHEEIQSGTEPVRWQDFMKGE